MNVNANNMKVSISRLLVDPDFYLFDYIEGEQTSEFLIVNEQLLEVAPFIDNRLEPYAKGRFSIATSQLSELMSHEPNPRPRQHFIFHHAFVCSTLLARCLSQSEAFFSLKEPQIVRRLSDIKLASVTSRGMPDTPAWREVLHTHIGLLAKHYTQGRNIVIKASNVANNLIPDVLEYLPASRLLYMHCSLEEFLISNLKKPEMTQLKIAPLLSRVARYNGFYEQFPQLETSRGRGSGDISHLLRNCALLWLASNLNFLDAAAFHAGSRAKTLCMHKFISSPRAALQAVSRYFSHEPNELDLNSMTSKSVMSRHSKNPCQIYDESVRRNENDDIRRNFQRDIAQTLEWINPLVSELQVVQRLAELSLLSGNNQQMANKAGLLNTRPTSIGPEAYPACERATRIV